MKKIYLFFALFTLNITFNAQTYNYAFKFGDAALQQARAVAHDALGNVYVGGDFAGVIDLDPGPGTSSFTAVSGDGFLVKLSPTGTYIWGFVISGTGAEGITGISVDNSNNVFITGSFGSTADFDPSVAVTNLINSGSQDAFVAKYNSAGAFQWAFKMGAANYDIGYKITNDQLGNVLVAGDFQNTVDFDPSAGTATLTTLAGDAFLAKYNTSGNYIWALSVGSSTSTSEGWCVATDLSNNVFLSGQFMGTKDFDPSISTFTLTSYGSRDGYLAKYNSTGNFQWALSLGSNNSDYASCVQTDNLGNAFLSGSFQNTVDFDPSIANYTLTAFGSDDIYLAKYSPSGSFIFANKIGGTNVDFTRALDIDAANNVFLTGYFRGTADFDPSISTATITALGFNDMFVGKYNSVGQYQYSFSVGNTGFDEGTDISVGSNGYFYVAGSFEGTADFNPGIGINNLVSSGNLDAYIAKYADCLAQPSQPSVISGGNTFCLGASPQNYSVALVSGATSYSWSLPGGWTGTSTTNIITSTVGITGGNISAYAINACGTSSAQVLTVTVNPSPTITVNSGSICSGNSYTMNASGANTYTYQGGNAVVSPTSTTSYTVVGTNTLGCASNIATSNVTVNPNPTVTAVSNTSLLCVGQSATLTASGASTYTFNPGGSGANITVSPTVTTTYTITGTNTFGCQNTTSFTQSVSACTGINTNANVKLSGFELYPNPTSAILTIELNTINESTTIALYNSIGQLLTKENLITTKRTIDLNNLANGIYFVKVQNENQFTIKKIIKQ